MANLMTMLSGKCQYCKQLLIRRIFVESSSSIRREFTRGAVKREINKRVRHLKVDLMNEAAIENPVPKSVLESVESIASTLLLKNNTQKYEQVALRLEEEFEELKLRELEPKKPEISSKSFPYLIERNENLFAKQNLKLSSDLTTEQPLSEIAANIEIVPDKGFHFKEDAYADEYTEGAATDLPEDKLNS